MAKIKQAKKIKSRIELEKQIPDMGAKLLKLEARQRHMVIKMREQAQTLNPYVMSLQTISSQNKLKTLPSKLPLQLKQARIMDRYQTTTPK